MWASVHWELRHDEAHWIDGYFPICLIPFPFWVRYYFRKRLLTSHTPSGSEPWSLTFSYCCLLNVSMDWNFSMLVPDVSPYWHWVESEIIMEKPMYLQVCLQCIFRISPGSGLSVHILMMWILCEGRSGLFWIVSCFGFMIVHYGMPVSDLPVSLRIIPCMWSVGMKLGMMQNALMQKFPTSHSGLLLASCIG